MYALGVLPVLSILLAVALSAPQRRLTEDSRPWDRDSPRPVAISAAPEDSSGGGGGFFNLDPLPTVPPSGGRPHFPLSGPAGSPGAAIGLAGSAAHNLRGASGSQKGVGIRVFQSDRVNVGAGFSTNFKGDNAGGVHVAIAI